jgi:hypothetical protein
MKRALSQSQAAELLRAASMIAPASRDGFLREVDDRLRGIRRQLTDEDVAAAIIAVVGAVDLGAPMLCEDAQPNRSDDHAETPRRR